MKPYFETKLGKLYHADALEVLKELPDESVDLVLTDPPYNIANKNKLTKVGSKVVSTTDAWGSKFKDSWESFDEYADWLVGVCELLYNKLKETGSLVMFLDRTYTGYFIYRLERMGYVFRNKLYFIKTNPLPHVRKNNYRSVVEEAIWMTKSNTYFLNFISQREMIQVFYGAIGINKKTNHPTEKYEWMVRPIVERHSMEGDLILDPFAGSGTTLVVAEKMGRRWIGIEISQDYCEIIKQRFENEVGDLVKNRRLVEFLVVAKAKESDIFSSENLHPKE